MDDRLMSAINSYAGRYQFLDSIMIAFSKKVRYLFLFILIVMWFRDNHYKKIVLNTLISVVVSLILNGGIKKYYFKPRPFLKFSVNLLPPIPSKRNSSFPSKHTIAAFAAATSVLLYKRGLGKIMYCFAFLTGFSRIWMGQHYPSDILGSVLLGSLTGIVVKLTGEIWNMMIDPILNTYHRFCSRIIK